MVNAFPVWNARREAVPDVHFDKQQESAPFTGRGSMEEGAVRAVLELSENGGRALARRAGGCYR
jgi:hypothetical protein